MMVFVNFEGRSQAEPKGSILDVEVVEIGILQIKIMLSALLTKPIQVEIVLIHHLVSHHIEVLVAAAVLDFSLECIFEILLVVLFPELITGVG